eukprot:1956498-Rhodomonas_salina.2
MVEMAILLAILLAYSMESLATNIGVYVQALPRTASQLAASLRQQPLVMGTYVLHLLRRIVGFPRTSLQAIMPFVRSSVANASSLTKTIISSMWFAFGRACKAAIRILSWLLALWLSPLQLACAAIRSVSSRSLTLHRLLTTFAPDFLFPLLVDDSRIHHQQTLTDKAYSEQQKRALSMPASGPIDSSMQPVEREVAVTELKRAGAAGRGRLMPRVRQRRPSG